MDFINRIPDNTSSQISIPYLAIIFPFLLYRKESEYNQCLINKKVYLLDNMDILHYHTIFSNSHIFVI